LDVLVGALVVVIGVFTMLAYVVAAAAVFVWDMIRGVVTLLRHRSWGTSRRDAARGTP
jgi:hypothetical protein